MNIYVSNLGFGVQPADLEKVFSPYGIVSSVKIIMDRLTNKSRGFGFIQMAEQHEAEKAILELNGSMMEGRAMVMNEARQREEKQPRNNFY